MAFEEFRAIPPPAVFGVGQCHPLGIARIPGVLRHAGLLGGGLAGERGKRRTRHATAPSLSVPIGTPCTNQYKVSSPNFSWAAIRDETARWARGFDANSLIIL